MTQPTPRETQLLKEAINEGFKPFFNEEQRFLQWRTDHENEGFFLNSKKGDGENRTADRLHRAHCRHLFNQGPNAKNYTNHDYYKIWSPVEDALYAWAIQQRGEQDKVRKCGCLTGHVPSSIEQIDVYLESDADQADEDGAFDPKSVKDSREKALRSINLRRGQPDFRKKLLAAYGGRCAMCDCDCVDALEAAHIQPYGGDDTNHVQNGLLLRSDIHVLFDLGRIGVDPSNLTIIVSDKIRTTQYGTLHGKALRLPNDTALSPNKDVLIEHRTKWGL